MTKGIHLKQSKIESHRLGHIILNLLSKGWSYSQIKRDIKVRYDVDISKSGISRYLDKTKDARKQESYLPMFKEHSADTIRRVKRILHTIRTSFDDIDRLLDGSSLKPIERSKLKKDINYIMTDLLEEYAKIESTTIGLMALMEHNYEAVNNLIIAFSNELCHDCGRKVADLMTSYEQSNDEKQ